MFLGIVFDNHGSNKLEKPTLQFDKLLWFCPPSAPPSPQRHLLVQSAWTCLCITHIPNRESRLCLFLKSSFPEGYPSIFEEWQSLPEVPLLISPSKRRPCFSNWYNVGIPGLELTLLPSKVPVVCFINHSANVWIHFKSLRSLKS